MPNVTFPCPFCGKKMAVGEAMLGKKVRCPSCKQVVVAPATADMPTPLPPPPPAKPSPAKVAPTRPAAADDLPVFNVQPRESHESIFSNPEDSEEEIFGSSGVKLPVPEMPEPEQPKHAPTVVPTTVPGPLNDNPFGFSEDVPPSPPPPPQPPGPKARPLVVEEVEPTADYSDPFGGFEDPPPQPIPEAVVEPIMQVVPLPTPVTPKVAAVFADDEEDKPAPRRQKTQPARRPVAATTERSGPGMGFYILLGYAILMTAMTLYGFLFRYGTQIDPGHPLSTIPDNFGEFPPAERKKSSQLNKIIDAELSPQQRVALGRKLEIGQVEIEPIKVEARPLGIVSDRGNGNATERDTQQPALVMTMRIRNTSGDLSIYPMDPAFTRKFIGNTDEPKPGTALAVGKEFIRGGEIAWPPSGRNAALREFDRAQERDATPLKPGESRDYVVFTAADRKIVDKVKATSEPLLWRVQVRRGVIDFKGKEVPVTAIIGVEFKPTDVKDN